MHDPVSGKNLHTLVGHTNDIRCVAFSPHDGGRLLASASYDGSVRLWDTQTHKCIQVFILVDQDHVYSVAFSPDGSLLAFTCSDSTVRLRVMPEGLSERVLIGHKNIVYSVAFSPSGHLLASASWDRTVRLWNIPGGEPVSVLHHPKLVFCVAFSPLAKSHLLASGCHDGAIRLWDVSGAGEKKPIREWKGHGTRPEIVPYVSYSVMSVTFSPDGRQLASASEDKTVKLWSVASGTLLKTLKNHTATVRSVVFYPNGDQLASGSHDETLSIWTVCEWSDRKHHLFGTRLKRLVFILMCVKARQETSSCGIKLSMQIWLSIFYELSLLRL